MSEIVQCDKCGESTIKPVDCGYRDRNGAEVERLLCPTCASAEYDEGLYYAGDY